ncbi:hypothetical protein NQ317_013201 [Molorchus minor]|uniref:Tyrosine-protein kinase Wsck n=1 Tax=Molorchus minor TaxID=1323400 RepID=A0ABQ9K0P2_9CUCU|nr:hypothetical protein NQ317_013201 [Molorchus minor]
MLKLYFLFLTLCYAICYESYLLGCYKGLPMSKPYANQNRQNVDQCIKICYKKYYRYAYISNDGQCTCSNYFGEEVANVTCDECNTCDINLDLKDLYATGNLGKYLNNMILYREHCYLPGPPRNFTVTNITENSLRLSWQDPESYIEITKYQIKAIIIDTFSKLPPVSPEWLYPNNTFQAELITLQSSTKYNITLSTKSVSGDGALVYKIIETLNKDPDILPHQPIIVKRDNSKITVKLMPTNNNNGPVTAYQIIVVNSDLKQGFEKDSVLSYDEAKKNGLAYYVAAELKADDINKEFVVGDGHYYGSYYNAPLDPDTNYDIILALVSQYNGITKIAYSDPSVTGLSIAIGLLSFMLIAGIIVFIILKSKVVTRRQRLSDNQELTLQGPVIEVENNGYIHEEDHTPVNYYRNLRQKVRTIPANQLKVEPTNLLGRHENLIGLIGTCETSQMVCIILDYVSMNLKDLLLGSRDTQSGRFSYMSEAQALDIAIQIARGMAHLESCKIIHKQLCARSVMVTNGFTPKISSYGIAQYFSHNKLPDYTRWKSIELFKGLPHNPKSDVWSFACLLWEISALGGTPYGNVSNNNEMPDKIMKGLRLPQLPYINDDLYQIMLDCWQLDCDERPTFTDLMESLEELKENTLIPCINFNLYSNFQYEQFYPDMELAVRPVF